MFEQTLINQNYLLIDLCLPHMSSVTLISHFAGQRDCGVVVVSVCGKGAGRGLRRLAFGSNARRCSGAAVNNTRHRASPC